MSFQLRGTIRPYADSIVADLLRPHRNWDGCCELAAAVLMQAVYDAFSPNINLSNEARQWAREPIINDPDNVNPYASGEFVCAILNVNWSAFVVRLDKPYEKKVYFRPRTAVARVNREGLKMHIAKHREYKEHTRHAASDRKESVSPPAGGGNEPGTGPTHAPLTLPHRPDELASHT